jgi:hypothetical protein
MKTIYNTFDDDKFIDELAKERLSENEEGKTLEEIKEDLYSDYFALEDFYNVEAEKLENYWETKGYFVVLGSSMGWRNLSGASAFYSSDTAEFLRGVVGGDFDHHIKLSIDKDKTLVGVVSSHDSPTGEGRKVYTLLQFIKYVLRQYSLADLHAFLRKYRDANNYSTGDVLFHTAKPHKPYISKMSKKDIAIFIFTAFDEGLEEFDPSEAYALAEVINYYIKGE